LQYTIGIATGVPVYFLSVGNSTDGIDGLLDTVNYVSAQNPMTRVMTTSYLWDEGTISRALAAKLCQAYAAIGAQGVSVLFSSGDGGVAGVYGEQCTTFVPTFPSGCP
jgi:tripeptidyl-peptidase-1